MFINKVKFLNYFYKGVYIFFKKCFWYKMKEYLR